MTREKTVTRLAALLSQQDGREWLAHPNGGSARVQNRYAQRAEQIVVFIEGKMLDYKWSPES